MIPLLWAGLSDIGRIRHQNEDRFHADADRGLFLVADGMGGAAAGEVAAQTVVDMLPEYTRRYVFPGAPPVEFTTTTENQLKAALADLSTEIRKGSERSLRQAGMGTTAVVAIIGTREVMVGHLGDSRAYRMRHGQLQQLTDDHNLAQALIESGELTPEQAASHSGLRRLTRYVGMRDRPRPDVATFSFNDPDRLLLCTDGLTTLLDDATVQTILNEHPHPRDACRALIAAANAAGGNDNTTAIIIQRAAYELGSQADQSAQADERNTAHPSPAKTGTLGPHPDDELTVGPRHPSSISRPAPAHVDEFGTEQSGGATTSATNNLDDPPDPQPPSSSDDTTPAHRATNSFTRRTRWTGIGHRSLHQGTFLRDNPHESSSQCAGTGRSRLIVTLLLVSSVVWVGVVRWLRSSVSTSCRTKSGRAEWGRCGGRTTPPLTGR
ncbi:PP2C family serine/threonine-protein phosphatase [Rhodococcus sp. NCIMB 12038]|uniref:PP2C family protein-serine/threonine phosphatase n=1 Tax=Rhodococcus sp. NCIMB 12038 TaxID=933800 RepID=UPI000B3CE6B9|nr:protein phosphatase 2C domain-containing protein [Rhodococcus sp. NCIMB 12038]OUS97324.1 hypothetical protein CA951_02965 [Rhodococcus sp. NCIMB 12038]